MYLYLANEGVMVSELVVDVISFQKIFGLCGIMEIWTDVTLEDGQRSTECEDRARILETEFAIRSINYLFLGI